MTKNILLWVVVAVVLMTVFNNLVDTGGKSSRAMAYSEFLDQVESGSVKGVEIEGREITWSTSNGNQFKTYSPETDMGPLVGDLRAADVGIEGVPPKRQSVMTQLLISSFPILLLIGVWVYFMRQMQGGGAGGRGAMSFGKSKARMLSEDQVKVTFADVAGADEAKEEVGELVEFLSEPAKFQKLGGKIPRGVLMVGPPGTGKTLFARAIAGEAKVPFFTISGSDFVEMFVGVGASRVRDMFEQAKKHSPCIIFIDEIDAVGRHRGSGMGGGHDEREQTLNQLLVEMDGFEGNEGVIVIAATNRPDVLDPALLRPGRFDRQVVVGLPDVRGREQILKVHLRKVPMADDVNPKIIARGTPGFSGADLANLVNEAALFAARSNARTIAMSDMERAKDKIMMGAERKSMVMTEEEKRMTAYHEAGHAVVGRSIKGHDPVYKVSIIPRGRALGVTMFLPDGDKLSETRAGLEGQIASLFGGRIAEDMIFGADMVSTGASNDIERATKIAKNMVTKWGLSKLGPIAFGEESQQQSFIGGRGGSTMDVSEETAKAIDEEVAAIIDRNYERAEQILKDGIDKLHAMTDALMKYETIDVLQIDAIMEGREVPAPKGWTDSDDIDSAGGPPTGKADAGDKPAKPDVSAGTKPNLGATRDQHDA